MTAKKKMAVKTKSKKKPTQQPVAITLVPNDLTSAPGQLVRRTLPWCTVE